MMKYHKPSMAWELKVAYTVFFVMLVLCTFSFFYTMGKMIGAIASW